MSRPHYIIICRGQIAVSSTKDPIEKICHASDTASRLVNHIDIMNPGKLTDADCDPISELQHFMMDNMHSMTKAEVDKKVAEMFTLLDALEDKFEDA